MYSSKNIWSTNNACDFQQQRSGFNQPESGCNNVTRKDPQIWWCFEHFPTITHLQFFHVELSEGTIPSIGTSLLMGCMIPTGPTFLAETWNGYNGIVPGATFFGKLAISMNAPTFEKMLSIHFNLLIYVGNMMLDHGIWRYSACRQTHTPSRTLKGTVDRHPTCARQTRGPPMI